MFSVFVFVWGGSLLFWCWGLQFCTLKSSGLSKGQPWAGIVIGLLFGVGGCRVFDDPLSLVRHAGLRVQARQSPGRRHARVWRMSCHATCLPSTNAEPDRGFLKGKGFFCAFHVSCSAGNQETTFDVHGEA